MKTSFFTKISVLGLILSFTFISTGLTALTTPRTAHAQGIVDFVLNGSPVLDGCDGIGGSKYSAIAAQLGLDLEGGIEAGLGAAWNEFGGEDLLGNVGDFFGDTGIGEAISSAGSSIADSLGGLLGGLGSLGGPVGSILGSTIGGLFGGGGPDEVVEKGLRKLEERGQKILLYEQQKLTEKDRCLDALAQKAGQEALRELTDQSINWVQGGFERSGETGNPGFIRDLNLYQNEIADDEYSQYVADATEPNNDGGSFSGTCNFLRRPVMESVHVQYNSSIGNSGRTGADDFPDGTDIPTASSEDCALTERGVTQEQAEAFTEGSFAAGGWGGLAVSASNPGSNPISAWIQQQQKLDSRINKAEEEAKEQLRWGRGFIADDNQNGFTPGSIVQGITERIFTSDVSRLELIDEMGEVAGDLGRTLISKISGGGSGGGGLSNVDGGESIGGAQGSGYEYLARQLREDIADQLQIEREVDNVLSAIVPLYQDERLNELTNNIQACLADGSLTNDSSNLLSGINNNLSGFRNSILQTEIKIDWNGDELNWIPVIKEESQKQIGWNGSDYQWKDDEVERYFNQGTPTSCRFDTPEDEANASYIILPMMIYDPQNDIRGVFSDIEPLNQDEQDEYDTDNFRSAEERYNIDLQEWKTNDGNPTTKPDLSDYKNEVHMVWEKRLCNGNGEWKRQKHVFSDFEPEDTPEGEQKAANAQCDLIEGKAQRGTSNKIRNVCVTPAYRAPTIISGQIYVENQDGEIEASSCRTNEDAGTHYFVNGDDETWSTRQCVTRQSPQGAPVEWEAGFPESAEQTNIDAYGDATTTSPRVDQADLVQELEELQEELNSENADVLAIQQTYNSLQRRFNSESTVGTLQQQAEKLVADVRELNQKAMETEACTAGSEDLNEFGDSFLNEMEALAPSISSFEAYRTPPEDDSLNENLVSISWSADAESCRGESSPVIPGWNGALFSTSSQTTVETPTSGELDLSLICERGWKTVRSNQYIFSLDNFDNEGEGDGQGFGGNANR